MRVIAFDTETALFGPGNMAPALACVSYQDAWDVPEDLGCSEPMLLFHTDSHDHLECWLKSTFTLVGHNVAYDLGVVGQAFPDLMPLIFKALEEDRITDTMIRQKLIDIGRGEYRGFVNKDNVWIPLNYSLLDLTRRHTGRLLEKDEWRMRYGELREIPLEQWPEGAIHYPKEDARATLDVYLAQEKHKDLLKDQYAQTRAAWWLHLTSAWGLLTSPSGVEKLRVETENAHRALFEELYHLGLVRGNGSRNTKAAKQLMQDTCTEQGKTLRITKTGEIALDADACEYSEDEGLKSYAELSTLSTVLAKDIPALASGTLTPIHTRFDLAATGRTTSSKPNVQNWRRLPGIRECFIPRPGYLFAQSDYDGLELRTLAQACLTLLGKSELAKVLNSGLDPHLALAAQILQIEYEEALERKKDKDLQNARQTAKVANFGFPGGLGIDKLILFAAKSYNVILTREQASALKSQWLGRWTEMREYFAYVNELIKANNPVEHVFSGRVRGGASYTAACNSFFQGLGSDATKHAGFLISKACYVDTVSPLFGSRIVNYIHDEFIVEVRDDEFAGRAAEELARLMMVGANKFLPDVPAKTEPLLMRYWSKDAQRKTDSDGRLIAWNGVAA